MVDGKIPAGRLAVAACQRQLDDLQRWKTRGPYEWRPDLANRVCSFISRLRHLKGPLRGQPIKLEPWQEFVLGAAFGWVVRGTNLRRFRRSTVFVPRGNGKSCISSGVGIYCLCADGEGGAEVYSAATTREQAQIVFADAQAMVRMDPELQEQLGLDVSVGEIRHVASGSVFRSLSRDTGKSGDGKNVHLAIVDEIHAHKTRDVYDVLETGTGKRRRSLIWVISTAGFDTSGIGHEIYDYARKVLRGEVEDDALFAAIWEADPEDDWRSPATWEKANPNWGVSVEPEVVEQLARKAKAVAAAAPGFRTKHLNQWTNADQAAFDLQAWDRCADPALTLDSLAGQQAVIALDLASKTDIAAEAVVSWQDRADETGKQSRHYAVVVRCWLPDEAIRLGRHASYQGWHDEGYIRATPGDVLDFRAVRETVETDSAVVRVVEVAYDPWQALQLAQELEQQGTLTVEVRPTVANFSPAMNELDAAMRAGRLRHDGSPVLRWMVGNVVAHRDAKDNIYPRKTKPENKIDGVIAILMGISRAMVADARDPYEERGIRTV